MRNYCISLTKLSDWKLMDYRSICFVDLFCVGQTKELERQTLLSMDVTTNLCAVYNVKHLYLKARVSDGLCLH